MAEITLEDEQRECRIDVLTQHLINDIDNESRMQYWEQLREEINKRSETMVCLLEHSKGLR